MPSTLDLDRLENVHTAGAKTIARCPACAESGEDKTGEHLFIMADGRFGCVKNPGTEGALHRKRIFALAGMIEKSEPSRATDRKPRNWKTAQNAAAACTPGGYKLAAVYLYPDKIKATARYENSEGKTYRQFHLKDNRWIAGGPAEPWPLYGSDALPAEGVLYVVEGEPCQQAAASIGLSAVTSAGGAKAPHKTDWRPVAGRDAVILPDHDPEGDYYAETVSAILTKLDPPARVRIVRLPVTEKGADIVDLIRERETDGKDAAAIRAEIEALAAKVEPAGSPATIDGAAALRDDPPPHKPVLAGLFDWHALVEIVGPSKTRKSFLVLMLALLLASGKAAFGFAVNASLRVCIADLELSEADIRRRLWRMGRALGIDPADIEDRLRILPLAGAENVRQKIETAAAGYDVLICDPLYALCDGGEGIEDLREPLRWLRRLAVGRAAALFVHHDAKGAAGDRETRDRGSGSGITGRAVDARITVTPAAADPENTVVMGFMCRSYVCPEPRAFTFADDAFRLSDLPAEPERQSDRRARAARPKLDGYHEFAMRILQTDGPMSPAVFKRRLRDEMNASKGDADDLTARLCEPNGPAVRWREGGFATAWKIGTAEQAATSRLPTGKKREEGEEG